MMDNFYERYQRQIVLPELGEAGQRRLSSARVLVIGAGGLGCPALIYLAAAGIGNLGIVDDDVVSLNNLHRQVLFSGEDIGLPKITAAKITLGKLNPAIKVNSYGYRLSNKNALELFSAYDIVLDCTDNFPTRYMINDACVLLKKPLVFGAISKFEGQVAVFNVMAAGDMHATNYRDLFPNLPKENDIKNCEEAGVIGVLPGIIGGFMANETIKLIAGFGEPLVDKMLITDLLTYRQQIINIQPVHAFSSLVPQTESEFKERNYKLSCTTPDVFTIGIADFLKIKDDENTLLVDVREPGEIPVITKFKNIRIPLSAIKDIPYEFAERNIVLFCQSGKRSLQAAGLLRKKCGTATQIYSLQDGIASLL